MRTGIATVCLSGTLKEKMQACAIAGFDGIETIHGTGWRLSLDNGAAP